MYRYKNLHFRFSADTCTSTFVTANIFPWYLFIRENFANEAVLYTLPNKSNFGGKKITLPARFLPLLPDLGAAAEKRYWQYGRRHK